MTSLYDPNYVARYFDDLGEREWTRLINTPADEVKLYIHSHYLEKYIEAGDLVWTSAPALVALHRKALRRRRWLMSAQGWSAATTLGSEISRMHKR